MRVSAQLARASAAPVSMMADLVKMMATNVTMT